MANTLSPPTRPEHSFKRVAILFAGGPAPAANAVISAAAHSFLRAGVEVIGIKHGYSALSEYDGETALVEDKDYVVLTHKMLRRTRSSQGIMIGTARSNPGKMIGHPSDLDDAEKVAPMKRVSDGLKSLGVDALISIGGDDTLKTANKFKLFQEKYNADKIIPVVHLPKTIDNDYHGIDFTFGFFTAVDFLATEIRTLIHDAEATRSYFLAETMGRSAGWLSYGAAIAGEASLVISVEDVIAGYLVEEEFTDASGEKKVRKCMDMERVCDRVVKTILARENEGKEYGVIVMAEGLAEYLPFSYVEGIERDDHGHINISQVSLFSIMSKAVQQAYSDKTNGRVRLVKGLQLGYEARCAQPHAFDAMLGSQLGVGAFRALAEQKLNGVMVSVSGQLDLHYVPFEKLVDPDTLVTVVRYIDANSDFHRLARFLETHVND